MSRRTGGAARLAHQRDESFIQPLIRSWVRSVKAASPESATISRTAPASKAKEVAPRDSTIAASDWLLASLSPGVANQGIARASSSSRATQSWLDAPPSVRSPLTIAKSASLALTDSISRSRSVESPPLLPQIAKLYGPRTGRRRRWRTTSAACPKAPTPVASRAAQAPGCAGRGAATPGTTEARLRLRSTCTVQTRARLRSTFSSTQLGSRDKTASKARSPESGVRSRSSASARKSTAPPAASRAAAASAATASSSGRQVISTSSGRWLASITTLVGAQPVLSTSTRRSRD